MSRSNSGEERHEEEEEEVNCSTFGPSGLWVRVNEKHESISNLHVDEQFSMVTLF